MTGTNSDDVTDPGGAVPATKPEVNHGWKPAAKRAADPALNTAASDKAAARSRSGGVWSLGHLPMCLIALVLGGVVLGVAAGLATGTGAIAGVALGTAIVGVFFSLSALVIARLGARSPRLVVPAALGTYILKIVALGVVLTVLPRDGFLDTRWMAGAVGLGIFAWLGAHMRYVWTTKIYYVDPG